MDIERAARALNPWNWFTRLREVRRRRKVASITAPVISDRLAMFTLLSAAFSLLLPTLFVALVPVLSQVLPDSAAEPTTYGALVVAYIARVVATFGLLWAALGVVRWAVRAIFRRTRPLGQAALTTVGGLIAVWIIPSALISFDMTDTVQLTVASLAALLMVVLVQFGAGRWPHPAISSAADSAR